MGNKGYTPPELDNSGMRISDTLQQFFPKYAKTLGTGSDIVEQNLYDTAARYSPQYARTAAETYKDSAPLLAEAAGKTAREGATQDLATLQGSGGELAKAAQAQDMALNPEYFTAIKNTGDALNSGLSQMSGGLNGSERAEIERYIGNSQSGQAQSAANTVKNATTYGQAGTNKLINFLGTVGNISNSLGNLRRGNLNSFDIGTGRTNPGLALAGNTLGNGLYKSGGTGYQLGQDLNDKYFGLENLRQQIKSKKPSMASQVGAWGNAIGSSVGSIIGGR
jgi:hypothetical protein